MNWLGRLVQEHVKESDIVLDVGCGVMQTTTDILYDKSSHKRKIADLIGYKMEYTQKGNLKCKTILGCDVWKEYLKEVCKRYPTINLKTNELFQFIDKSYDVVLCLDVLEHLPLDDAICVIDEMIRITRHKVIIYTPSKFITNEENVTNAWDKGENPFQAHKSIIEPDKLREIGFTVSFVGPDKNTFGIYIKTDQAKTI